MVDHVRHLLVNDGMASGARKVSDRAADSTLALFGLTGGTGDAAIVSTVVQLALAPDLVRFRAPFDERVTPSGRLSVYRHDYASMPPLDELHSRVLGREGWQVSSRVFVHDDAVAREYLTHLRRAAMSLDSAYALGAVLLACAYRRLCLQGEVG